MSDRADPRRRTVGPVVLLGLASAGVAAVAGNRDWVQPDAQVLDVYGVSQTTAQMPLAAALALVVLACWGVLLVTRGRVRRVIAWLGVVASAGLLATSVVGYSSTADSLQDVLHDSAGVQHTGWYWVGLVAAVLALVATAAAVRLVPSWPEMGSRYDAPGAAAPPAESTPLDLWRAMDEGRDPTLPEDHRADP
jgi:MFS family permease